ncbi:hypothetical protein RhiirA1_491739 [Rhizophagus irregularis]|uniref:Uncharacterized protein n=1 Tax=Rhizophagus irregularis TaxID=588596 RepID=A0A2N0SAD4_9GLOM|nr:hypothetical protein RhiirA1_491739 [Rhizophagus irregularis]
MATATSSIPNNPLLGVRSLLSILPEDLNLIEKSHWVVNKQDAENTQEDPQKIEISMSKAINPDYVTDSTSDSPPISDGENSDNKENYKADETRKKKRKSTGIEGMDEKGGENEREREREQKI